MNKEELNLLKLEGYMQQQDKEYFSLRVLTSAGNLNSDQVRCLSDIADKYGRGYIGFTTRQCIEIPWIKEESIPEVKRAIEGAHITTGGTGYRVIAVAACKGTLCKYGLIDSQELSRKLEEKFLGMDVPGKFKIGISACPNNCVKAPLSDLGFMAQNKPRVEEDICKGCRICERTCKVDAIEVIEKKAKINYDKCVSCGQCIKACPFKAMELEKEGIAVFIGGKGGRQLRIGERAQKLFNIDELVQLTEKVINYSKENSQKGERLGSTIDRLGLDHLRKSLDIK
ncbi:nitrite and sulphite reductase 4Fe-4S region [Clostridium sp. DL-VIII]|uniref:4Fe-4S binding protein n=1 Tax=Clostridium sp. DL-VIII TaxID=641107 RepID=UPI00023AFAC7|nr:4Fe-4S binding protein [Clostridium sp. DL-VIII]EHJ00668.1 nitrite and sulphite reductase 4Fe-4S region [Clostridium sp. DL-VIII]